MREERSERFREDSPTRRERDWNRGRDGEESGRVFRKQEGNLKENWGENKGWGFSF